MTKHADLSTRLTYALAYVRGKTERPPDVGVVLGSGLGAFADRLEDAVAIPYEEIPAFPISRVPGHAGRLVVGRLATPHGAAVVAAMQGRVHLYEGWTAGDVAFGVRVLGGLGVRALLLTNAAGGINPAFGPGDLVRITDHLNLTGQSPLVGDNEDRLGPRFPDMSAAWNPGLAALLDAAAEATGVRLAKGVYAGLLGPAYETPAEVRMLRALGADLVGMSTVVEAIAARHMGVKIAGLSVVSNLAAGLGGARLEHAEVQATADRVKDSLGRLVADFVGRAAQAR
ncbi:MAG TPA: purine-nucleoside phosphorylase [Anaeromyxobacteraceae bacterium]|nr:purine-nucleoside phosphorylase [Anaeromyxobacteraceae bacterium]